MHYREYDFSTNGQLTIQAKVQEIKLSLKKISLVAYLIYFNFSNLVLLWVRETTPQIPTKSKSGNFTGVFKENGEMISPLGTEIFHLFLLVINKIKCLRF